jgi:hypothetical protein
MGALTQEELVETYEEEATQQREQLKQQKGKKG